jgi:hypothetical protein
MQIAKCKMKIGVPAILHLKNCGLKSLLRVLCALCGYSYFALCSADAAELVRLDGQPVEAKLQTVNREALAFVGKPPIDLPLYQLVRWGHRAEPRPQIIVVLNNNGRLVTAPAWSGGAPLRLNGEDVIVLTDTWNEVRVPRAIVGGFVFAQRQHAREREKLERLLREKDSEEDAVLLTNQDRVTGKLTALAGGSLTLETEVGPVKLPLSRVEAVVLADHKTGGSPSAPRQPPSIAVGTADGSLIYADGVTANENGLMIEAAGGVQLKGGSVDDIVLLQSLGGRFVYLSDLEPEAYRHVPYLAIEWPFERDRNVLNGPLSVDDKRYLKGIGMHSAARLTYRLDGQYRRFDSAIVIDDSAGARGSVTFGAYVLRDSKWQEAFTSGVMRGGEAPRPISVDIAGADGLTLTVDYADRGDEMDRADWLDARVVKSEE